MSFDFVKYVEDHRTWALATFGPFSYPRILGVIDHIKKEAQEVRANFTDVSEWVDIIILGIEGATKVGFTAEELASALLKKQNINFKRKWPDWRTADSDKAIEHIKED